jgi:arylformamidase
MKTLVSEPEPVDKGGWIDVTVPIRSGMVHWPGNPEVRIERSEKVAADGGVSRTSALSLGSHTGTHFDAPSHFGVNDTGVDALPIDALIGPARVVSVEECAAVERSDVERLDVQPGERLLLKTRNSSCCWRTDQFVTDYVYVTPDAAAYLVERRVRTLGVDYLSVGGRGAGGAVTHRILLGAGVCVLEGLDLSAVAPGFYDLVALPLRIAGGDGAPARAVLRRR